MMTTKRTRSWLTWVAIMVLLVSAFPSTASALSDITFCVEFNCNNITVTFGGSTHPSKLGCSSNIVFTNLRAGTYALSASGCDCTWEGTISIDGRSSYLHVLCPGVCAASPLYCSSGCGPGGILTCEPCPSQLSLKTEDQGAVGSLHVLRRFRDEVLNRTLAGMGFVELYYKHAPEMVEIIRSDSDLRHRTSAILKDLIPILQARLEGEDLALNGDLSFDIEVLLDDYISVASPPLAVVLEETKEDMISGKIFDLVQE